MENTDIDFRIDDNNIKFNKRLLKICQKTIILHLFILLIIISLILTIIILIVQLNKCKNKLNTNEININNEIISKSLNNNFSDVKIIDKSYVIDWKIENTFKKGSINYNLEKYLFDTPYIYPVDISKIDRSNTLVIFLGYAHISVEEEINLIREHDKEHYWTTKIDDDTLRKWTIENIEYSKVIEEECKKYNIKYTEKITSCTSSPLAKSFKNLLLKKRYLLSIVLISLKYCSSIFNISQFFLTINNPSNGHTEITS